LWLPIHLIHVVDELEGHLAYATSDGAIGLVKVTQVLCEVEEEAAFTPRYQIELHVEHVEEDVFRAASPTGVTALKWIVGGQHEVHSSHR